MWHHQKQCYCVRYLKWVCFPQELFGLAPVQIRMCGLITQAGDQWAYPGIVLLNLFDGVSLRALTCGQNDIQPLLDITWRGEGPLGCGYVICYKTELPVWLSVCVCDKVFDPLLSLAYVSHGPSHYIIMPWLWGVNGQHLDILTGDCVPFLCNSVNWLESGAMEVRLCLEFGTLEKAVYETGLALLHRTMCYVDIRGWCWCWHKCWW